MGRGTQALQGPDSSAFNFGSFPRRSLRAGIPWFRQHRDRPGGDHGAWFFAGHRQGVEGDGRFDLPVPEGTCYLSSTEKGAINELIGPEAALRGWVDADLVEGRVLSRLLLPTPVRAANVSAERAGDFRVTRELTTTSDYTLTQQWAATLHAAGFGGILADLRFTLGTSTHGLALFGAGGTPTPPLPGDPSPQPVRPIVAGYGIEVVDRPTLAAARVVSP